MKASGIPMMTVAFALLGPACSHQNQQASATPPTSHRSATSNDENVPFARTGTEVEARVERGVDTRTSADGDEVSATLTRPIRDTNGHVLVPSGTPLHGRIVHIDRVHGPHVELDFDSVTLRREMAPIGLRVVSMEQSRYEAVPVGKGVTNMQASEHPAPRGAVQIEVPPGALLHLVLTRPMALDRPAAR